MSYMVINGVVMDRAHLEGFGEWVMSCKYGTPPKITRKELQIYAVNIVNGHWPSEEIQKELMEAYDFYQKEDNAKRTEDEAKRKIRNRSNFDLVNKSRSCTECNVFKDSSLFPNPSDCCAAPLMVCKTCKMEREKELIKTRRLDPKYVESRRAYRRSYYERRKTDPPFLLANRIRTRTREVIREHKGKRLSATKFLGCSYKQLKHHMEAKFTEGMSWKNVREWHVDHITPLSSFDLTDPKQFAIAAHYTNLQPLWAKDNLSKGAKIL